jgi:hypothetical protein
MIGLVMQSRRPVLDEFDVVDTASVHRLGGATCLQLVISEDNGVDRHVWEHVFRSGRERDVTCVPSLLTLGEVSGVLRISDMNDVLACEAHGRLWRLDTRRLDELERFLVRAFQVPR